MILTAERNLNCESLLKITTTLNLNFEEKVFLEALMQENQAKTKIERDFHFQKRKKVKSEILVKNNIVGKEFPFNKWYYPALILYLIDIENIREKGIDNLNISKIREIFSLKQSEIEDDLRLLQDQNLLRLQSDGKYHFYLDNLGSAFKRQDFISKVIEKSLEVVSKSFDNKDNYFSVDTISISKKEINKFKLDYQNLISQYIGKDLDKDDTTKIMQLALQMFTIN
jgi:uncharacterized protein (TIGR02147 family)